LHILEIDGEIDGKWAREERKELIAKELEASKLAAVHENNNE